MNDTGHFWVSLFKSTLRILGFVVLTINITYCAYILILAEILGVI